MDRMAGSYYSHRLYDSCGQWPVARYPIHIAHDSLDDSRVSDKASVRLTDPRAKDDCGHNVRNYSVASRTQKECSCRRSSGSGAVREMEVWPSDVDLRG